MSDCKYHDDGSGCLVFLLILFCLWGGCNAISGIRRDLNEIKQTLTPAEKPERPTT